jgi:hypothetical protein
MDTTAEVPEFKIAKVGKDRKRRGAGVPWLGGGGKGAGLFSGATGGVGSGAAAGMGLLGKVAVLGLIGTLSAGAWQFGKAMNGEDTSASGAKPKVFADSGSKYSDADLANVMRSNNGMMPNSLGYVSGSLDGMTPEERARKEAEAAEAARLAEEEARKAEEEAAKAQPADVAGSPAGIDPNALLKGAQGAGKDDKSGPFSKKFGSLSTSFGGGLAGGSGLAGGVGRGFSNADLNNKASAGKVSAMRSAATRTSMSKARPARNTGTRGLASRQLSNANALSRQAAGASGPENSAQAADAAFNANNGAGNVISGPGVGNGGGSGVGDSGGSTNPNTGGPVGGQDDPYQAPATPAGKNVTKWQGMVDMAKMLLMVLTVLGLLALILEKTGYGAALLPVIYGAMVAVGAIVALLGIAIMAMGQYLQGAIFTAIGAIAAYLAYQQITTDANQTAEVAARGSVDAATSNVGTDAVNGSVMEAVQNGNWAGPLPGDPGWSSVGVPPNAA